MPPTVTVAAPDGQAQWVVTAVWKAADRKPPATPDEIRASTDPFVKQFVNAETDGPLPFHYPTDDYRKALMEVRS